MKNLSKKFVVLLLAAVLAIGSFAVSAGAAGGFGHMTAVRFDQSGDHSNKPASVEVTGPNTVEAGKQITLKAEVKPEGADQTVTWKSSNEAVATVTQNGVVTGVKAGKVHISATAKDSEVMDSLEVTVTPKPATQTKPAETKPATVAVTSVSLNKKTATVNKGKTITLKATVKPSNATNPKVTWSTSNKKVATVTNGKVKGVKAGKATITAKASNGKKATCKVTVKVPATKITLSKKSLTLTKGKSATLKVTVKPKDTTDKATWSTSNKKVATVSKAGKVTAKKVGTAKITVKVGSKEATCKVTVKAAKKVSATSVKLNKKKLTLKKGKSAKLKVTVKPKNSTDKATWSTSNKKVATVSKAGKVTAKKKGKATITVKAGKKKATCKVTVK